MPPTSNGYRVRAHPFDSKSLYFAMSGRPGKQRSTYFTVLLKTRMQKSVNFLMFVFGLVRILIDNGHWLALFMEGPYRVRISSGKGTGSHFQE